MWPFPFGETVYVLRAARVEDPYSGRVERLDWDSPERRAYDHCAVEFGVTDEPHDDPGRAQIILDARVFGPADMDVDATDRLEVRGEVYEVIGVPQRPRNPWTGWEPGTTVKLRRVRG